MPTPRACIGRALRALGAIKPGDDPTADELAEGLSVCADLCLELHEARGPMTEIDVAADTVAGENQRLRIAAGATVNITLPNAVQFAGSFDPYDYGFTVRAADPTQAGTTDAADGYQYRAPRDGSRIEIVGQAQGLWFYRSDINAWQAAMALSLDGELPIANRLAAPFSHLLAERLAPQYAAQIGPALASSIARARAALFGRFGTAREPVAAEYF